MSNSSLYTYMREHLQRNAVQHYLEIGTREGDSMRVVLEETASSLESAWVADLWGSDFGGTGRGNHQHIEQLFDDFNFAGRRVYLDGNSRVTIPALMPEKAEAFDLILVDGDHSYEGGMADLVNTWPLLKPGGAVLFHDICHPRHLYLRQCFEVFARNHSAPTYIVEQPYGLGVAWKR
jgi:hypothetical protein